MWRLGPIFFIRFILIKKLSKKEGQKTFLFTSYSLLIVCHGAGLHDLNYFYVKMSRRQPPPQSMQSGVGFYVMPPDAESQRGIRLTNLGFFFGSKSFKAIIWKNKCAIQGDHSFFRSIRGLCLMKGPSEMIVSFSFPAIFSYFSVMNARGHNVQ